MYLFYYTLGFYVILTIYKTLECYLNALIVKILIIFVY